jgi:hypothetical protein
MKGPAIHIFKSVFGHGLHQNPVKPRVLWILSLLSVLLLSACSTPRQQQAPLIQPAPSMDPAYALHISKQVGRIERVVPNSQLVVIATRPELQNSRLQPGSRLECRSVQYEITGLVEVGANPSARYITAKIVSGSPQNGDLVLLAPNITLGVPQTTP